MRKKYITISILITCISIFSIAMKDKKNTALENIRPYILLQIDSTIVALQSMQNLHNLQELKANYKEARKYYKHIEFFVEYNSNVEAKYNINGALVPKFDQEYGNETKYPNGFQKIEEIIFSATQPLINNVELKNNLNNLTNAFISLKNYYSSILLDDELLAEMMQVQLYRIVALNLNGYDATISKAGITESVDCLMGLQQVLKAFTPTNVTEINLSNAVYNELEKAISTLLKNKDYDSFERLPFIANCMNPLNKGIILWHNATGMPWSSRKQALNLQQPYLFTEAALNKNYFSIYFNDTANQNLQAQLGKKIFFDKSFSANKKIACSSCHQPNKTFTDGLQKAVGLDNELLTRNTPTLWNVIYQKAFFADGRAYQLEQQSADVLHNALEMGVNITNTIYSLQKNKIYKNLFYTAFRGTADTAITEYGFYKAIAAYEKTLVNLNKPFDKFLQGNNNALTKAQINGYNLFAGKALCGSCHFMPLFNGTVPPFFNDSEFEIIGTPATVNCTKIDDDEGRYTITKAAVQRFGFKTPSLRNIANTAPYMHNGVFNTLEQVVEFYHKGGGQGFGYAVPNQTLPFDSLQLNQHEKKDIIAFLKTL